MFGRKKKNKLTVEDIALHFCKVYGYGQDGITYKNVNSALVMAKYIEWSNNTYIVLNSKIATKEKRKNDRWEAVYFSEDILNDSSFVSLMDAKFKKETKEPKAQEVKEEILLTPTKIGEYFKVEAKEINRILIELKLQIYDKEKGYMLVKKDGSSCLKNSMGIVNNAYEKSSIKWNSNILSNPLLVKAIKGQPVVSKKTIADTKPKRTFTKSVYIEVDRDKWMNEWHVELGRLQAVGTDAEIEKHLKRKPSSFRTERGDMVPSKNEVILANALLKAGAPYICGEVVKGIEEVIVSDFYLPYRYLHNGSIKKLDLWCEYWGDMGASYEVNKKRKRDLAKKHGFNLVEFPASTSEDMTTRLERILDNHPAIKATGLTFRELNKAHSELVQQLY